MKDKKQNKRITGGHRLLFFCILCLFGLYVAVSYAEEQPQREQSKTKVILLHTDNLTYDQYRHPGAQILTGNVQFQHDGVLMYCDSACFYEATNSFDAFGHVKMVQGIRWIWLAICCCITVWTSWPVSATMWY